MVSLFQSLIKQYVMLLAESGNSVRKTSEHTRLLMWSFLFIALCITFASYSGAFAQTAELLWIHDLSKDVGFSDRLHESPLLLRTPNVAYLNSQQILVSYDDGIVSQAGPTLKPFAFHIIEMDARSNQTTRHMSLPTLTDSSEMRITNDESFVVLAGEDLTKYSSDFRKLLSFPTPLLLHGQPTKQLFGKMEFWNPHFEGWTMDISPSGEVVLLVHHDQGRKEYERNDFQWLSARDFSRVLSLRSGPLALSQAGTNDAITYLPSNGLLPVLISPKGITPICTGCSSASFISDDLFFITKDSEFQIVDSSKKIIARGPITASAATAQRALRAKRFAYSTGFYQQSGVSRSNKFTSVHMDVRVFDWSKMRQVAEVGVDKRVDDVSAGFKQSAVALSPNGRELLILDDSKLSCYRLP